jgi:signal transduction histidine kinase
MIILVLQAICIVLFAFGVLFSVLELRTRLDRSFLYFGIVIMLLAAFSAIDLWRPHQVWWTSLQHILYFFIVPCIGWYLMILTKSKNILIIKGLLFIGLVFSFLVLGGFMFVQEDGFVGTKALYRVFVVPYIILSILYMNYLIVRKLRHLSGSEKKSLFFHLIGFLLLSICGIIDLLMLFFGRDLALNQPSCTIFGVIGLSAILCYSFADRLILSISERENSFAKLQMAYKELEEARSLSELGKSSAIINHEVRNYATVILGFAQLLKYNTALNDTLRPIVEKIIVSINRLTEFSNEILDLSKAKILREKNPLNICELIRHCVHDYFPNRTDSFTFINMDQETTVYGDRKKLEQVFLNMFRNSFEAQATRVVVKIIDAPFVKLIAIEDDGVGCNVEDLKNIFNAFYTSQKKTGTGLGLSIARSIIEGHGGNINVATKNFLPHNEHGLVFSITFPAYQEAEQEIDIKDSSTVLIKKDIDCLEAVVKTFRNVRIMPDIIQDISDFRPEQLSSSNVTIIGNPDTIREINERYSEYCCFSVASSEGGGLYVEGNRDGLYNGIFCEEFVVSHMGMVDS